MSRKQKAIPGQIPGQGVLFDASKVTSHQFDPVEGVVQGIKSYTRGKWQPVNNQQQVDSERQYAQGLVYKKGMAATKDTPRMQRSYASVAEHINSQYEFMTKPQEQGGMGIRHEIVHDDPYPTPQHMAEDVRTNRRIKTFATRSSAEGLLQEPTKQALPDDVNDKFRAVHDVFGHAASGRGFSRHGEEAAYLNHRQMFPKEAHAALASELRGQNSYLINEGSFPNPGQRMVNMPDWATRPGPMKKGNRI